MKKILAILAVFVAGLWVTGIIGPIEPPLKSEPVPPMPVPLSPATSVWIETPAANSASAPGLEAVPTSATSVVRADGTYRKPPPTPTLPVEIMMPAGERTNKFSLPSAVDIDPGTPPTK